MYSRIIYTCPNCGNDLVDLCYATYPPQYGKECFHCGWKSEIEQEKYSEIRVPYQIHIDIKNTNDYCKSCPNNIKNGGAGICDCILGTPVIY